MYFESTESRWRSYDEKSWQNLEEDEVAIIEEIAEDMERKQKGKLPVLTNVPKKKLLE